MKFLVIGDEPKTVESIATALLIGWPDAEVQHEFDTISGLMNFALTQADLVVVDLEVVNAFSLKICERLREASDTPVIALLPATASPDDWGGARANLCVCMTKPLDELALISTARSLLAPN